MKDEEQPPAVELLNTLGDERHGEPGSAEDERGLRAWLADAGDRRPDANDAALFHSVLDDSVLDDSVLDVAGLRRLRDALRVVAARVAGATPTVAAAPDLDEDEALRVLNQVSGAARWWFELDTAAGAAALVRRGSATGSAALLGRLAEDGIHVFAGELLACTAPGCWRYFTRSDPRRQWCSAVCGNRARVARHYARQQAARSAHTG
ncbi:MAG TPA: CGNR zinc finger domain-containing protein [Pseudonocardia sp.]|nr:CGNR zinc finger domain-containing protein [Pseudonocardia sp.]